MTMETSRRGFVQLLSGGIFAKKEGDQLFILDPSNLGDADRMRVLATGTTHSRFLKDRFADVINVKDFGAKGDGVTDDTAAIQAALATSAKNVFFPQGSYLVSGGTSDAYLLTSSVNERTIYGNASIICNSRIYGLLSISGNNTTLDGLIIKGNGYLSKAIHTTGKYPVVRNCEIYDLDGKTDSQGIGIWCSLSAGDDRAIIEHNIIKNVTGTTASPDGKNRAIVVYCNNTGTTGRTYIHGNVIENITGTEGDAIVIQGGTVATPLDVCALIQNNTIDTWTRRGIKIAANNVTIDNNNLTCIISSEQAASIIGAIDVTAGSNIVVSNNVLKRCDYQRQIGFALEDYSIGSYIVISGNTIYNTQNTANAALIYCTNISNLSISHNTVYWPTHTSKVMTIGAVSGLVIRENDVYVSTTSDWLSLTNTVTNIRLNQLTNSKYNLTVPNIDRDIKLINLDTALSSGETIATISAHQNDSDNPDKTVCSIRFYAAGTSGSGAIAFHTGSDNSEQLILGSGGLLYPSTDNAQSLGTAARRFSVVYAGTGSINTSDKRQKNSISEIDERVFEAWANVRYNVFRFNSAVKEKGDSARLHVGLIAQDIKKAFEGKGLNAEDYGLYCYDKWDDEYETVVVVDEEAVVDSQGFEVKPAKTHKEKHLKIKAGDAYAIRYEEALALECAYQRWLGEKRDARIAELEAKIANMEKK